jgi:DMSO/TMAO reductase YedYZ molybdopterin-dependent catalytic subunit
MQDCHVLLAYAMNGEPLPVEHGHPLRAVAPAWYAVASVKWLIDIEVVEREFRGHFQGDRYVLEREREGRIISEPVRRQRVRALTTRPLEGETVEHGELVVGGLAWSGLGPIAGVEVSVGGGNWRPARLLGNPGRHAWQRWQLNTWIERAGRTTIRARARDVAGRTQPERGEWNRLGYGNNAIQEVRITAS